MRALVNEKSSKYPEMKSHNFLDKAKCKWNCSTFNNLMKGQVVCDTTVLSNTLHSSFKQTFYYQFICTDRNRALNY